MAKWFKRGLIAISLLFLTGIVGAKVWWSTQFPKSSTELVSLNAGKQAHLEALRRERKFQPDDYPPLGYTGTEDPAEERLAVSAVNKTIDLILSQPTKAVPADLVVERFAKVMDSVDLLPTEDRERTWDYLLEIWYILGFHGNTGLAMHGAAFPVPDGYKEPLPRGWKSPTSPRPIEGWQDQR